MTKEYKHLPEFEDAVSGVPTLIVAYRLPDSSLLFENTQTIVRHIRDRRGIYRTMTGLPITVREVKCWEEIPRLPSCEDMSLADLEKHKPPPLLPPIQHDPKASFAMPGAPSRTENLARASKGSGKSAPEAPMTPEEIAQAHGRQFLADMRRKNGS